MKHNLKALELPSTSPAVLSETYADFRPLLRNGNGESLNGVAKKVNGSSGYKELIDESFIKRSIPYIKTKLAQQKAQFAVKRMFDIVGSLALIALLSPIFIGITFLIRLTSTGPIIFCQKRVGFKGRFFRLIKFRSMVVDHDSVVDHDKIEQLKELGVTVKMERDPRVTKVGNFLRRSSVDELPQLFNVLKGEMSLVGPRPLVGDLLDPYPQFRRARTLVRPGLTGLWQVRAREHNTHVAFMVQHDLEYLQEYSIWQDLKILVATIPTVLSGKGAY